MSGSGMGDQDGSAQLDAVDERLSLAYRRLGEEEILQQR